MTARIAAFALLLSFAAGQASAQSRTTIRLWNVGGQAAMTLGSAGIQHKIFNFANGAYVAVRPYGKRWPEMEAFQLTAPSDPWR